MPKFNLYREVTYIEYYDDVEADTPEEAIDIVRDSMTYTYADLVEAKKPIIDESEVCNA
jgi:hypothetical protein